MDKKQTLWIKIAMIAASVLAIAAYFFKYFSIPLVNTFSDMFFGEEVGLGSDMGVVSLFKMCQEFASDEPLVIVAAVLLFGLPVLLLLVNIALQAVALANDKMEKASGIFGAVSGGILLIVNLFIGIFLRVMNDGAADEIAGGFSSFLPDFFTVGAMWWVQLIMACGILAGAIVSLVTTKDSSAGGAPKPEDVALIGVKGQYAGCVFKIKGDDRFILGRDAAVCNVVFSESESKISRRHCEIHYNYDSEKYIVTDYSSNGTYVTNGKQKNKLPQGKPMQVAAQFYLEIGNDRNVFKLN